MELDKRELCPRFWEKAYSYRAPFETQRIAKWYFRERKVEKKQGSLRFKYFPQIINYGMQDFEKRN